MKRVKYILIIGITLLMVGTSSVEASTLVRPYNEQITDNYNETRDYEVSFLADRDGASTIDFCSETRVLKVFQIIGYALFVLKILVPLILIVLGSVDFAKSVISSDEKSNKEALSSLIKRIIAGIIIFLIPTILNYLLLLIDGAAETTNKYTNCTNCVLNPFECSE